MRIVNSKIERWLPHIVGVLFFSLLPLFVFEQDDHRAIFWIISYYYQLAFMIIAFYANYLFIFPRFFFAKKKIYFFASLILFAIVCLMVSQILYHSLDLNEMKGDHFPEMINKKSDGIFNLHPKLIDNFFLLLLVFGFSTGMAILHQQKQNEEEQKEIEKASLDSELAFLKSQISPHFFFNSLNNIYALIALDSDKAQKAVEKLSGLMRYLIYESDIKMVELQREFEFTQNYIDLMQQRLTAKVKLSVNIQHDVPQIKIPPLIFITFIENAFKHGVSYRETSFIDISLSVIGDEVVFNCVNSIQSAKSTLQGGLGTVNVKKRLDLIYGDKAKLKMEVFNSEYLVDLSIPIEQNV